MRNIINELIDRNITIATMESCTGGAVASYITDFPNASKILKYSSVTYSNEYKIKMGVSEDIINKYSVYSMETAHEMANKISLFANSDIGIGITGKLKKSDENNNYGKDNIVFVSIYYKNNYYDKIITVEKDTRRENKNVIIDIILIMLGEILDEEDK